MTTTPIPPEQEEEARRQAGSPISDAALIVADGVDAAATAPVDALADAAAGVLGATADAARVSIEAIGNLFGAIGDL